MKTKVIDNEVYIVLQTLVYLDTDVIPDNIDESKYRIVIIATGRIKAYG
jgi:hypothetical protein